LPSASTPASTPAIERLRELTGLGMEQLATLFDVSRGAVYKWREGSLPRGERQAHLQEALTFAEAAFERFRDARELNAWLHKPVAPGEQTPLQLMSERRWRALRGLLLQTRSPLGPPPERFPGPLPTLSPQQSREVTERLSPRSALEDLGLELPEEPHET
jgi:transcriptional regulator with XRE-family HTH domain